MILIYRQTAWPTFRQFDFSCAIAKAFFSIWGACHLIKVVRLPQEGAFQRQRYLLPCEA